MPIANNVFDALGFLSSVTLATIVLKTYFMATKGKVVLDTCQVLVPIMKALNTRSVTVRTD